MRWFLALPFVCLGCAGPMAMTRGIPVARAATFDLLPPASFGRSLALEQVVEGSHAGTESTLRCALEIDTNQLRFVAFTPMDTVAFTVTLGAAGFHLEERLPGHLPADPRQIIADLQIALWPELPSLHGLVVVDTPATSHGKSRRLMRGADTVIEIEYGAGEPWDAPFVFRHLERGYALRVVTVDCAPLDPR